MMFTLSNDDDKLDKIELKKLTLHNSKMGMKTLCKRLPFEIVATIYSFVTGLDEKTVMEETIFLHQTIFVKQVKLKKTYFEAEDLYYETHGTHIRKEVPWTDFIIVNPIQEETLEREMENMRNERLVPIQIHGRQGLNPPVIIEKSQMSEEEMKIYFLDRDNVNCPYFHVTDPFEMTKKRKNSIWSST